MSAMRDGGRRHRRLQAARSSVPAFGRLNPGYAPGHALPYPPAQYETGFGLAVKSRPPFILSAKFDAANVEPGKPIVATVTVSRAPGFAEEIVLNATGFNARNLTILNYCNVD